jgi:sortase (surface protein transpeptidase)
VGALVTLIACQAIYTAYHRIFAHGHVVEQMQHQ